MVKLSQSLLCCIPARRQPEYCCAVRGQPRNVPNGAVSDTTGDATCTAAD